MWRMIQRALLVTITGALLGLTANAVSPRRIPYITPPKVEAPPSDYIPLDDAKRLWARGDVFFLDARAAADYALGHIGNAFNLPVANFEEHYPQIAGMFTPETSIIVYCDGMECDLSHDLTKRLRQIGYKNVHILQNGWTVWQKAGLPTSTGEKP